MPDTPPPGALPDRPEGATDDAGPPAWPARDEGRTAASEHHPRHRAGTLPDDEPAGDHAPGDEPLGDEATHDRAPDDEPPAPLPTRDRLLVALLGARTLALDATPRARALGWAGAIAVTLLGAVARFWHLGRPGELVFDETYYVKDGFSLWRYGYEGQWGDDPNPLFQAGDTSSLTALGEYVVHPPVGKWLIGLGIRLGGVEHPWSWRLAAAVAGTLAVLVVARVARRLTASTALGTLAGLLMAVDGMAIVFSRTSLLDQFLMVFLLLGFACLLLDRERSRRRLAERTAALLDAGAALGLGPRVGPRPWRFAAALCLGLAVGTKWSALYFVALFALMSVAWDATARRTVGVRAWPWAGVWRDGLPAALVVVPTVAVVYLASWTGWLVTRGGYQRQWAEQHPGEGVTWLPAPLRSLLAYHGEMWRFHNGLTTPHSYQAHPLGWLVQWRPTLFFYDQEISHLSPADALAACGADRCAAAVTSLGNPITWWLATAAALVAVVVLVRWRDWRAGAALSGVAAGWLPWFAYAHRTIFAFYSIAFLPWMILTLVLVLGIAVGTGEETSARARRAGAWVVGGIAALVVAVSVFFYPIWTGELVTFTFWHLHIWLPGWT